MIPINFVLWAYPIRPEKTYPVHLHINQLEPTWGDTPRGERMAIIDAAQIVRDIVANNSDKKNENLLLRDDDPPHDAFPIFRFTLGVSWNRELKIAHYSRVGYERYEWDAKWLPAVRVGMELYEYTYSVIHGREKSEIKKKSHEY